MLFVMYVSIVFSVLANVKRSGMGFLFGFGVAVMLIQFPHTWHDVV